MKTIDQLLDDLIKTGIGKIENDIPLRDKKILISLHKQIKLGHFLTKNQGDLLLKIFKENHAHISTIIGNIENQIETPLWSNRFRVIQPVRKIYRKKDDLYSFTVEFTWNKRIQQAMSDLSKQLQGNLGHYSNKAFSIQLTEKNIHLIVSKLQPLKFEISEEILTYYEEICRILNNPNPLPEINLLENNKIFDHLYSEIGGIHSKKDLLICDRQIRFQYAFRSENSAKSLVEKIAARGRPKIYIKSSQYGINEVFDSIHQLTRFPCLVILSGHESLESLDKLKKISEFCSPSVYFRFDNTNDNNIQFNTFVTENNFNQMLNEKTQVVVLANNKLPKFMFKSNWYPKSVISFTNNFRTNKTSIWCDAVDLQIYYTDKPPMIGSADAIV